MTALTLPGSIPGLLRRGSPVLAPIPRVRIPCMRGVVDGIDIDSDGVWVLTRDRAPTMWAPSDLQLDLTDATGRAHAAWWILRQGIYLVQSAGEPEAVEAACRGADDPDGEIVRILQRIVLAGVSP